MQLTWRPHTDPIFGKGYVLTGLREGESGAARRNGSGKRYVADAFIGGRYLNHHAGTLRAAMSRLERDIDRRSIGLLGVDDVDFVTP